MHRCHRQFSWLIAGISFLVVPNDQINAQMIGIKAGYAYLEHSNLGGISAQIFAEKSISQKFSIGLTTEVVNATGTRILDYRPGEKYTLSDPEEPETNYDASPTGLLEPEDFVVTFPLRPDRTTQLNYGVYLSFFSKSKIGTIRIDFVPVLSSIHKTYIADVRKGTFTNLLGTYDNINLVSVFYQDYLDIGANVQLNWGITQWGKVQPELSLSLGYLRSGDLNYGISAGFRFGRQE